MITGFQGARLQQPITVDDAKLVSGVTLNTGVNRYGPYQHAFTGCTVTRRLGRTGVPQRGDADLSKCEDDMLRTVEKLREYAKEGCMEVSVMEAPFSGKPYPEKCKQPDKTRFFMPSEIWIENSKTVLTSVRRIALTGGEYAGRKFRKSSKVGMEGKWVLTVDKNAKRQSRRDALASRWEKVEKQADTLLASDNAGIFMCVCCGEFPVDEDSFLLCSRCVRSLKIAATQESSTEENDDSDKHSDSEDHNHSQNRKNRGLQNDGKQKLHQHTRKRGRKCQRCRKDCESIYVCLTCEKVKLCVYCKLLHEHPVSDGWTEIEHWIPDKKLMSTDPYQAFTEGYRHCADTQDRPLTEEELAHILAVKYPNFTKQTTLIAGEEYLSLAYRNARIAAAMLVGHYIFKKTFTALGKMLGKKTDTVKKFCVRARSDYWTVMLRQPVPTEVQTALSSYMLRDLYPRYLTEGMLVRQGRRGY